MSDDKLTRFEKFLSKNKDTELKRLEGVLETFDARPTTNKITCKFYLIACTDNNIREEHFIKFILRKIIRYVLTKDEYDPDKLGDEYPEAARDLYLKAKSKFMETPHSGEKGELTLFTLLESEGILQVVNKMRLKTNRNMPVFGMDAIHIQVKGGKIYLLFGEAKVHKSFTGALDDALETVRKFTEDRMKHDFELDIIASHIDDSKFGEFSEIIEDLVDPYSNNHKKVSREMNALLLTYDWEPLCELDKKGSENLTKYIRREFEIIHSTLEQKVAGKIAAVGSIKDQDYLIHLFPIRSVDTFHDLFTEELKK